MIRGLDVSHHNGTMDWPSLKEKGFQFAFFKATEGTGFVDKMFDANVKAASQEGFLIGAYHFFRPGQDAIDQANHFLNTVAGHVLTLPHVLDWEVSDHVRAGVQISAARAWLQLVETRSKRKPIIYGSPSFLTDLGLPLNFADYALWVANYGVNAPKIPKPWHKYAFWQTTDAHGLDLDVFNGTIEQLKAL